MNKNLMLTKTTMGFQRTQKGNFFASLGERETSKNKILLNTNLSQGPGDVMSPAGKDESLVVFTNMNVDKHDFDIKSRRIQKDQQLLSFSQQRLTLPIVPSENRLQTIQSSMQLTSERGHKKPPVAKRVGTSIQQEIERPMSGQSSTFLAAQQGSTYQQQLKSLEFLQKSTHHLSSRDTLMEDDAQSHIESQFNATEKVSLDKNNPNFSKQIMQVRPTTALIGTAETLDNLPYPELFDRSERTFAATFAKYGDLSYFTPVQRIGSYMEYSSRLTKRHLMDLIAYQKTS